VDICVFANENQELADSVVATQGFDSAIWIGENEKPTLHSLYDVENNTFTTPTHDYLVEIGIAQPIITEDDTIV
jgi:hypothetical protein